MNAPNQVKLNRRGKPAMKRGSRKRLFGWVSAGVVTALVVTLAVVASGFDSRETPREDPSVWVERMAGQYARVNTETAEIDTVRVAESSSGIVQTGGIGLLLTQGFGRAYTINPASPEDVHDDGAGEAGTDAGDEQGENGSGDAGDAGAEDQPAAADSEPAEGGAAAGDAAGTAALRTPDGTRQVIAAADRVLFFTQGGEAYLSEVESIAPGASRELSAPKLLDPFENDDAQGESEEDGEPQRFLANAAALDEAGKVALFSQTDQAIRRYDAVTGQWVGGPIATPDGVPAEGVQLAIVKDEWVLFDAASGRLWRQGVDEAIALDVSGTAQLQGSATVSDEVLLADEVGLWRITSDGAAERVVSTSGVAAQPRYVDDVAVAAWVSAADAVMWTSEQGEVPLALDESVEDLSNPELEIRGNGTRALLVERRTGMMWTVPDGTLIPVEQWSLIDPPKQETGTVVTQDVTEQEPPVAVDDNFGVRAGEPALLPVLLNDFDPNRKDVLTVVTEGLGEGLSPEFGTVTPLSDGQGVVLQPSDSAQGSASFSYRITDGVNISEPATVTVNVVSEETNSGPQWCPVEGCQRAWPSPEIAPGGTVILPILEGWVDPEGDPMMLASATVVNPEDPLRALVTADGKLAVRHVDANAAAGDSVVRVAVVDSRGETTEKDLRVRVRSGAAIEFAPAAATAKVGEPTQLRPLERVTGGSGAFQLIDAVVQQGAVSVTANPGTGVVEVDAEAQGNAILNVTVRDTVTEQETTGVIRVTAVENRTSFAVPPLRAFVRSLADSTVDVLAAIPGANSRALTVRSASVRDGQLRADVIEHANVRVSGSTFDGQPGRIGSVDIVVAEGDVTSQGRLTVFQVGDVGAGAIAVTDTATVRAGSVVDISVLENDVAPPGERLVLHPEVGASGAEGELAFASGSKVRYLAPKAPGVYTLSYTTYGASSPEQSDVGQVRVTVLAAGSNRDPQPATVTVRVAPGERVSTTIPLSGVDPDGDRLRLVSVDPPEDAQLTTSVLSRSNSVQIEASSSAQRGTRLVSYTVRDSYGGESKGVLRILVTDPDSGGSAPVVYSDYVRLASGANEPAIVRPLDNDLDPSGGTLKLVSVEPNVPGGEASPQYQVLRSRLDVKDLKNGIVRIQGGDELGTVSYKYTVQSSKTKSTADGLIVVQVSERIGQQAPSVTDTVLSVRDRADFEKVGVDVVTDRVRWAAGDASTLKLSLWGSAASRYEVNGSSIIGKYRAEGDLVPFRLAGTDMTGAEVESFGFLIVPPLDELRLSLKAGTAAISVAENKSVDADLASMLDLGAGDRIEVDQVSFTTQRQQATCSAVGATTIRYSAGKEAPWTDSCTVRVRLSEQKTYTLLPIPVTIIPDEPVVQLNPLTRTVAPGASEAVTLTDMVQWQGGREGAVEKLRWQVTGGTSSFEVTSNGTQVQAVARADAVPGSQEVLTVNVSGSGESQSLLTLRVGEAAVDAPRGGTVSLQCTVGSSCGASLVGVGGEYDPFAGKSGGGLKLVSVNDAGCQFGRLQASGDSVSVSWPDQRGPGGSCTATFTVKDAQNRTGTGTIELDAQGVPRAPSSISATGAGASSVTLSVSLSSQNSHPAVSGVEILNESGGVVASCSPSGNAAVCTVENVPVGSENGRRYLARAVNSVGPSDSTANASELTWAYEAPPAPTVVATPVKNRNNTDTANGQVELKVTGSDRARRFLLTVSPSGPSGVEIARNSTHTLPAGNYSFSVIPRDQETPPGYTGGSDGAAGTATAAVGAAPIGTGVALQTTGEDSVTVTGNWSENFADPSTLELRYGISNPNGSSASCSSNSPDFTGLTKYRTYVAVVCAQSESGKTEIQTNAVWVGTNLPQLTLGDYTISSSPYAYNGGVFYDLVDGPAVSGAIIGASVTISPGGGSLQLTPGVTQPVTAVQCAGPGGAFCSTPSAPAGWVNAPTTMYAVPNGVCYAEEAPPGDPKALLDIPGEGYGAATVAAGTPDAGSGTIPLTVTWGGAFSGLNQATITVCYTPAPTAPEPPVPGG